MSDFICNRDNAAAYASLMLATPRWLKMVQRMIRAIAKVVLS